MVVADHFDPVQRGVCGADGARTEGCVTAKWGCQVRDDCGCDVLSWMAVGCAAGRRLWLGAGARGRLPVVPPVWLVAGAGWLAVCLLLVFDMSSRVHLAEPVIPNGRDLVVPMPAVQRP